MPNYYKIVNERMYSKGKVEKYTVRVRTYDVVNNIFEYDLLTDEDLVELENLKKEGLYYKTEEGFISDTMLAKLNREQGYLDNYSLEFSHSEFE
ncbi:gp47 [Listeria phage P40]|uniref:gp47 n=1 Tax=Listeria phage P40 TaxID=560178 RepID=UPI00018198FC|nr:gp47 [Listeria phage P40]ACI00407.1 gp47 [Listeria phage P40]